MADRDPFLGKTNSAKYIKLYKITNKKYRIIQGFMLRQHRTKSAYRLSLDNRQVNCARFAQSDEKTGGASAALSLCGIALK